MDEVENKIIITFKDEGSILCTIEVLGVIYSDQFGMLSNKFNYQANRMREDNRMAQMIEQQERESAEMNKIALPGVRDVGFGRKG